MRAAKNDVVTPPHITSVVTPPDLMLTVQGLALLALAAARTLARLWNLRWASARRCRLRWRLLRANLCREHTERDGLPLS